tara:strand:- start:956 stop:2062 length:1107 start_codon:yes stop_codon:yes gene_type:complete
MKIKDIKDIIAEAYQEVLIEQNEVKEDAIDPESDPDTRKLKDYPKSFIKGLEDRYGKVNMDKDFISNDGDTYFKFTSQNKTTGSISHKIIKLPSFENLYQDYSDIILDIKKLMNNADVRKDKAARELFELIKTNFRKLQRYLRTERPDQYAMMKSRRIMEVALEGIMKKYPNPDMLAEVNAKDPKPQQPGDPDAPKETVLEDATDTILSKFPTLQAAIVKLQTEDFKEFVDTIDWISPRPSSFRINLKNGQDYILKWTGKSFQAEIMGKRYFIDKISEYQQALDKLSILYKEGPMDGAGTGEPADTDTGGGGGGGGDFPGGDDAGGGDEFGGGDEGGDEFGGGDEEGGGADLGGEEIDFEEPGEEPEA